MESGSQTWASKSRARATTRKMDHKFSTAFSRMIEEEQPAALCPSRHAKKISFGSTNLDDAVEQAEFRIFGQQRLKEFGFHLQQQT